MTVSVRVLLSSLILCLVAVGAFAERAHAINRSIALVSRQSVSDGGAAANANADSPSSTPDGRYVAFASRANNLSADAAGGASNVYVRDMQTGALTLVSRQSASDGGAGGDDDSLRPRISNDGRYVAFESLANNLSTADDNAVSNVFLRDLQANTTTLVSRQSASDGGAGGDADSAGPSVSDDGRYVSFASAATNLSAADGADSDIFVRDLQTNTTIFASRASGASGAGGDGLSQAATIAGSGQYVAFLSEATNLIAGSNPACRDVFVRDIVNDTTILVSRATGVSGAASAASSYNPRISRNGQFVVFGSWGDNLSTADYDNPINTTNDGHCGGTAYGGYQGDGDIFVRDIVNDTTTVVSRLNACDGGGPSVGSAPSGTPPNVIPEQTNRNPAISGNGRFVVFYSNVDNLSPLDNDAIHNIYVHDMLTESTTLVSQQAAADGGAPADAESFTGSTRESQVSDDGRFVDFNSAATNLTTHTAAINVYRADVFRETNQILAWGSAGSGNGQFNAPWGAAIDAGGDVLVSDGNNDRVQRFDVAGTFVNVWGSTGSSNGQFDTPMGLAINPLTTNVHAVDSLNRRIQYFADGTNTYLGKWGSSGSGNGQFNKPAGIAIDGTGKVFVADTFNNRVQVFSASGTFLSAWGTMGTAAGQLKRPHGIATDGSYVYVADTDNDRVQRCNPDGTGCVVWGALGSAPSDYRAPQGIAVFEGLVYVADTNNHRLKILAPNGTLMRVMGSQGSSTCRFDQPTGIAVDASNAMFVVDSGNIRVVKYW